MDSYIRVLNHLAYVLESLILDYREKRRGKRDILRTFWSPTLSTPSRIARRSPQRSAKRQINTYARGPGIPGSGEHFLPREPKDLGGLYGPPVERRRGSERRG